MKDNIVTVNEFIEAMPYIQFVSGEEFGERTIEVSDLSRPAIELTGYFDFYPKERIQLFGATEISFLERLPSEMRVDIFEQMCTPETPAFLISRGQEIPKS